MSWWFWSFWWLIFPIMGFAFGAFRMWMNYRQHKDAMELIKTYAAQGKDPAEIATLLGMSASGPPPPWSGYGAWRGPGAWGGPGAGSGYWGGPYGWGGPWRRWGPYREWRRFIVFTCLAVGFGLASRYADFGRTEHAFTLVAIIMGVLAAGSLVFAVVSTRLAAGMDKNEK